MRRSVLVVKILLKHSNVIPPPQKVHYLTTATTSSHVCRMNSGHWASLIRRPHLFYLPPNYETASSQWESDRAVDVVDRYNHVLLIAVIPEYSKRIAMAYAYLLAENVKITQDIAKCFYWQK